MGECRGGQVHAEFAKGVVERKQDVATEDIQDALAERYVSLRKKEAAMTGAREQMDQVQEARQEERRASLVVAQAPVLTDEEAEG